MVAEGGGSMTSNGSSVMDSVVKDNSALTPSISSSVTLSFSGDASPLSGWLKDSAVYFRAILSDKNWQGLISRWLVFEQCCQMEGVSNSQNLRCMKSKTDVIIETTNEV